MASIRSGNVTRRDELPRKSAPGFPHFRTILATLTWATLLSSCATQGVTKATGRVADPPLELVFYCLLAPADTACRSIVK